MAHLRRHHRRRLRGQRRHAVRRGGEAAGLVALRHGPEVPRVIRGPKVVKGC